MSSSANPCKDGTHVLVIDWSYAVPECFGISPTGTIWHSWDGATAWFAMPGNGKALDMSALYDWGDGDRTVEVWTGGSTFWCQDYFYGSGWAGHWYRCS